MKRYFTAEDGVKESVMELIKRRVKPGTTLTDKDLIKAYDLVYAQALAETIQWKQKYISPNLL